MTIQRNSDLPISTLPAEVAADPLMTGAEVAALWRVRPSTVAIWRRAGKLAAIPTLGGRHRYRRSEVLALRDTASGGDDE